MRRRLELSDLEANGDLSVDPRLRQIEAAIVVDGIDQAQIVIVGIARCLVAEGKQRQHRFADDLEIRFPCQPCGKPLTSIFSKTPLGPSVRVAEPAAAPPLALMSAVAVGEVGGV